MITDIRQAFLADIVAHPADDGLRLIYADWLEDSGEPDHAMFIRYGVANPGRTFACEGDGDVGLFCGDSYGMCQSCHELTAIGFPPVMTGEDRYEIRRGFVSLVRCTLRQWLDHGRAICAEQPVERVELTDKRPNDQVEAFCWWAYEQDLLITTQLDDVGIDVWHLLSGNTPTRMPYKNYGWKRYETEELAVDALSDALIRWARTPSVADR